MATESVSVGKSTVLNRLLSTPENGINFLLGKKLKIGNATTKHDACLLAW